MELLGVINDGIGTVVHFIIIDGFNENYLVQESSINVAKAIINLPFGNHLW